MVLTQSNGMILQTEGLYTVPVTLIKWEDSSLQAPTLKPPPKDKCQILSPFLTPVEDSMRDSTYLSSTDLTVTVSITPRKIE